MSDHSCAACELYFELRILRSIWTKAHWTKVCNLRCLVTIWPPCLSLMSKVVVGLESFIIPWVIQSLWTSGSCWLHCDYERQDMRSCNFFYLLIFLVEIHFPISVVTRFTDGFVPVYYKLNIIHSDVIMSHSLQLYAGLYQALCINAFVEWCCVNLNSHPRLSQHHCKRSQLCWQLYVKKYTFR